MKATLRKKLDVDFRRYVILGACNPNLAHRALVAEPQIGVDNAAASPVAAEAEQRLRRAVGAVDGKEVV